MRQVCAVQAGGPEFGEQHRQQYRQVVFEVHNSRSRKKSGENITQHEAKTTTLSFQQKASKRHSLTGPLDYFLTGADGETRTRTAYATTPSR